MKPNNEKFHGFTPRQILLRWSKKKRLKMAAVRVGEKSCVCRFIVGIPHGREQLESNGISSKVNVKWSRYSPGVAQRVGRGIALLFHDRGTRRGEGVVISTPRPHFIPGKVAVPILQEAGWVPGPVGTGGKFRLHWDSIPDRPCHNQSLYWLSYLAYSGINSEVMLNWVLRDRNWRT